MLHRDVKPSNCFVDAEGGPGRRLRHRIADTCLQEGIDPGTGRVLGTPAFASPEQLRAAPLDVRSDTYSVGATSIPNHWMPAVQDANIVPLISACCIHTRLEYAPYAVTYRGRSTKSSCNVSTRVQPTPQSYRQHSRLLLPYGPFPDSGAAGLRVLAILLDTMFVRAIGGALPFLVLAQQQQRMLASPLEWHASRGSSRIVIAYFGVTEGRGPLHPADDRGFARGQHRAAADRPGTIACSCVPLSLSVAPSGAVGSRSGRSSWAWQPGVQVCRPMSPPRARRSPASAFCFQGRGGQTVSPAFMNWRQTPARVEATVASPSAHPSALSSPPVLPAALTRLGPYVVLDETAAAGVAVGFDQQLLAGRGSAMHQRGPSGVARTSERQPSPSPPLVDWLAGRRGRSGCV